MTGRLCRATFLAALVAALTTAVASPPAVGARPHLLVGLFDDAQVYGNPVRTFPLLRSLRTQVLRVNMYWGGRIGGEPPTLAAPRFDDPAAYGPSGRPSVGYSALTRAFRMPAQPERYGYALLQSRDHEEARALKTAAPALKTLTSKSMASTFSSATTDGADNALLPAGVGYAAAGADHPDWFLKDANGERIESCAEPGRWLMDVGNPDYQAAWLENVSRDLGDHRWDGVLVDDANWSVAAELCGRPLAKYPTDEAYTAAVDSFLARVGPALRERGFTVVAAMHVPPSDGGRALWTKWLAYVSGAALSDWTKAGSGEGAQVLGAAWDFQQDLQHLTEAAGKPFLALTSGPRDDLRSIRYARASFLLGWSAAAGAQTYSSSDADEGWSPEKGVEVGRPLGPPRRAGAAWQREFSEGTVLVNPSSAPAMVKLDNTYVPPTGRPVTRVTLQAGSGMVLRFPKLVGGNDNAVASRRPRSAADPADPAYDWSLYDRTVRMAAARRIRIVFSILGTPRWANGGLDLRHAPSNTGELQQFAYAAAKRYSGSYRGPDGKRLPAVRLWLAWNEPNNPVFLQPQYRRVGGKWIVQSARDYARICTAVYRGVHATLLRGEKVGCGLTAPRGGGRPTSRRPSVTPLVFLRELKRAGLRHFDAYAHHPYYNLPSESPHTRPPGRGVVEMGNIDVLIRTLTRLYGRKRLWITEYGYQTNDPRFGVSWQRQASYLREAYTIARATRRIDMLVWFLLRDDPRVRAGWQSGFFTAKGKRKLAANVFQRLPR